MQRPEDSPGFARALLADLRGSWWIYVFAPVVMTVFSLRGWGSELGLAWAWLVNLCATLGIGLCSQCVFVFVAQRGWSLPYGLHNPLALLVGVGLGAELALLLIAIFASFDGAELRRGLWLFGGVAAAVIATVSITYDRLRDRAREVELREERASTQALQARLDALQSRMNPHFLFNSLNTVAALIEEDPAAAVLAVERLSELLRYTLDRAGDRLVPLTEELHCAREYLELERARFGDRLRVEFDLDGELDGLLLPPLSVQPLVENAVKHGVARSRTPVTIIIAVRRVGRRFHVEVRDDGPGAAPVSAGTGTAHATLAARLRLVYADAAQFDAGPLGEGAGYRALLAIPQELA